MHFCFLLPFQKRHGEDREQKLEELVVTYFRRGFLYEDILKLLKKRCDITFSIRTFYRIIKELNLKKKNVRFRQMTLSMNLSSIESGGEM